MNLLLPQTRLATVTAARPVDIHGDRYVDLVLALDDPAAPPVSGRVGANECPADLAVGDRVSVRFTMGVITRITRA